jgi:hypothetical protein
MMKRSRLVKKMSRTAFSKMSAIIIESSGEQGCIMGCVAVVIIIGSGISACICCLSGADGLLGHPTHPTHRTSNATSQEETNTTE